MKDLFELRDLFSKNEDLQYILQKISIKLQEHFRVEVRILIKKLHKIFSSEELVEIMGIHREDVMSENYPDAFWLDNVASAQSQYSKRIKTTTQYL